MTNRRVVLQDITFATHPHRLLRPRKNVDAESKPDRVTPSKRDVSLLASAGESAEPAETGEVDALAAVPTFSQENSGRPLYQVDQGAIDAAWKDGQKAGYDAGYQFGLQTAQHEAQQQIERLKQEAAQHQVNQAREQEERQAQESVQLTQLHQQYERLATLLQHIPAEFRHYLEDAEDDLLSLVYEVVCRVLGDEAASLPGLRSQLQLCLKAWHGRAMLSVHLHPDDLDLLQSDVESTELLRSAGFSTVNDSLQWVADSKITLGGCQFRSSEGALDARLEVQLQELKSTLLSTRASRKHLAITQVSEQSV